MNPPHILITGGSRGIGLSIARLFASNSYRCTLLSRDSSSLESAVAALPSASSAHPLAHGYISGDVSSPSFWKTDGGFGKAYHGGKIDVLANCAGVTQSSLLVRTEPEQIQTIIDTNLTGMMIGTRYLLRRGYIKNNNKEHGRRGPVIINVASLLGVKGGMGAVAYAASKAGVIGFTRALSEELGAARIRVNAIVPGYIATDMTSGLPSVTLSQRIPTGRLGTPEEVADAAWFFTKNQYANNCVLNLDGGLSAT